MVRNGERFALTGKLCRQEPASEPARVHPASYCRPPDIPGTGVQTGLDNVTTIGTALEDGDLPAGRFDAAIGRYMLMLLADPTGALAKVRRSLRGGAHAAMSS